MASTADFRNGLCLEHNGDLWTIVEFQHVKPGKGGAFVRTKLKSLTTGKIIENTFISGVKVTTARIENRPYQFLYGDDSGFHFMDTSNYEQITLQKEMVGSSGLLKDGQNIDIIFHAENEKPLSTVIPAFVELEIKHTEPGVKGDSATKKLKPAQLETGANINVPLFINIGDRIKIDTRSGEYVERLK